MDLALPPALSRHRRIALLALLALGVASLLGLAWLGALALGSAGGLALLGARYRRADRGRRGQLAWPLWTALLLATAFCWQALLGSRWVDLPVPDVPWGDCACCCSRCRRPTSSRPWGTSSARRSW